MSQTQQELSENLPKLKKRKCSHWKSEVTLFEVVVCDTSVVLKFGRITDEKTDAIVNSTNATLDQNTGISGLILAAAGDTVKAECARLSRLPNDGHVVTVAGNLECQRIIHLRDVTAETIVTLVKKTLKSCDQFNMASVSFPALGTDTLDAQTSIKLIIKGIEDYMTNPSIMTIISKIGIIVGEQNVYDQYLKFFQNYQTNYPHFTAFGKTIELIKGDITDQPVDCILNLTNQTLNQSCGVSGAILSAAGDTVKEECSRIGWLTVGGAVVTSGGNLKAKHIMHIIGPTLVPAYEPSIDMILLKCHESKFTSLALPAIGTGMARVDPEASIKAILNSVLNYLLEALVPTLERISIIVIQENIYKTYLKVFRAKCTEIQAIQRDERILSAIQAQVKIQYPLTWTNIGTSEFLEVTLEEYSREFQKVKNDFMASSTPGSFQVLKIVRIQHVKLWQSFWINKMAVDRKNPGWRNIRHLYHGTAFDNIKNINQGGFNRSYSGVHGTARGYGTYFAVWSNYSCGNTYSIPDSNGHKYVYQAAVITGKYCQGTYQLKEPPHLSNDPTGDRYDSVADNMTAPTYFVVFHDDYAYPEYLITFKSC
ncbi:protein mono-ADP-ribosyltransferase PARP15-like [Aquarana catesbeiana]|uniref:protein mono-ADP-ribosyltransferase PARP15-like n=1 Tax=Aquarana catesbeiana TaxID=8400 RepID=UPI003CC9C142